MEVEDKGTKTGEVTVVEGWWAVCAQCARASLPLWWDGWMIIGAEGEYPILGSVMFAPSLEEDCVIL